MGESMNKKSDDSMFEQNGISAESLNAEAMNRDYLRAIYGEELEGLNREVRYTRTAYIKEKMEAEEAYAQRLKKSRRSLIISAVIFAVTQIFTVSFYELSKVYSDAMVIEKYSPNGTDEIVRAYWAASGVFGSLSWIIFVLSVLQFLFFLISGMNHVKNAKETYERVVKMIEEKKKEQMLAGTYDATS